MMIRRLIRPEIERRLRESPAVAILGPRQCGKSTLARLLLDRKSSVRLDMEKASDRAKIQAPEVFFSLHKSKLVCIDEIQRSPGLFADLRSVLDENQRNGQILVLGSASQDLIRQSSETLAGRIAYLELTPFLVPEILKSGVNQPALLRRLWLRGGFPRSFLAPSERSSVSWREDFIRTFLERDIPQLNIRIPAETLRRFWLMCAHGHGQILNSSRIGESLGLNHTTIRSYADLLSQAFVLRILPPFESNLKKRLIKSPKIYVRDSGLLHALLGLNTFQDLLGHPVYGSSWEGFVIENVLAVLGRGWRAGFYRTSAGTEIDLVVERGSRKIGIECKASHAPVVGGGFWNALDDLGIQQAFVAAPVEESYPIGKFARVTPLHELLERLKSLRV